MDLKNLDVSQLTTTQTAQHVADMTVALEQAQVEYETAAREVLRTQKAWDEAWDEALLDDDCPAPNAREGVARRNAWIRKQTRDEWNAHADAKHACEVAQKALSTLGKLLSGAQTLDGSVRTAMSASDRNPRWGA